MIIESLYANVALITVRSTRWPVNIAGIAKFYFQIMSLYLHAINFWNISHLPVLITLVNGQALKFFVFVG